MSDRNWYIAQVLNNTERLSAERLKVEHEVFVASQKYVSIWKDGRRKIRERILIPGKVLVRCTEQERLKILDFSFVKRFMVDIASALNEFGCRKVAVVPDEQVDRLKFVLGQQDVKVTIDNVNLRPGEKIRVIRGSLMGLEGEISEWASTMARIHINIAHLGCASVEVNIDDIERV